MKTTLATLFASAALIAAIGVPALAAVSSLVPDGGRPVPSSVGVGADVLAPAMRVAESDGDHDGYSFLGGDDDEEDDEGYAAGSCGDDDDDSGNRDNGASATACAIGNNPAPAGTAAPPQNGLFATEAPPKVQVN